VVTQKPYYPSNKIRTTPSRQNRACWAPSALRHPKAKSNAKAKTLADAAVESHSCAENAQEWGTLGAAHPKAKAQSNAKAKSSEFFREL
jgi:hypothetical protein